MEKEIRSIIISDTDFSELIESNRLRIQASTLVSGIVNEDFDLSGIKDALGSIKASCPVQVGSTPAVSSEKPSLPISERPTQPACSDVLVSKMKAQGLKAKQILAICK